MRYPLVIGNWKLYGSITMVKELIKQLNNELNNNPITINCDVVIAPPIPYLSQAKKNLIGSQIMLGAQNVDIHLSGAYTGEISAAMLKDIGVKYIIIGHSERRLYHQENDKILVNKFAVVKSQGLIPVFCIGESEIEKINNQTEQVCVRQIDTILKSLGVKSFENSVIAYEPIWAIGTGKSASPLQAQYVHHFIRKYIAKQDIYIARNIIIQYGGSVNANNATELFMQPDIDGVLVGGSSLIAKEFVSIINSAAASASLAKTKIN